MARKESWRSSLPARLSVPAAKIQGVEAQAGILSESLFMADRRRDRNPRLDPDISPIPTDYSMPQCVVAFADALGTTASAASEANAAIFLARLAEATHRVSQRMERIGHLYQINVRWFSDSIAMSVRFDEVSRLIGLLDNLAFVQAGYALEGIFLRGAVTTGPHHHSEYIDYGPALAEAVQLERTHGGPTTRIVLSPTLRDTVSVFGAQRLPIVEDLGDRAYFLDFIGSLDPAARPRLREQIILNYQEAKKEDAKKKISWLAGYFDWRTHPRKRIDWAQARGFREILSKELSDREHKRRSKA